MGQPALKIVGGTEREDHMARVLFRDTTLSMDGAKVIVEILERPRTSNMERFAMLSRYCPAEYTRRFLQRYGYQ